MIEIRGYLQDNSEKDTNGECTSVVLRIDTSEKNCPWRKHTNQDLPFNKEVSVLITVLDDRVQP